MSVNRVESGSLSSNSNAFLVNVNEQKRISRNVIFRPPKTLQEKFLALTACLLLIVASVFFVSLWIMSDRWKSTLSQLKLTYVEEDDICETETCKETAKGLLSNIDPTTDPCVDFYQYACGGWMETHPIPEGKQAYMIHEDREKEVKDLIRDLLLQGIKHTDSKSVRNVKKLFAACMNKDVRNKLGVTSLQDLVKQYGGWPMLGDDQWSKDDYDWQERTAKANRDLLLAIFVDLSFKPNFLNNKYYVLWIKSGFFQFEYEWSNDYTVENVSKEVCDYIVKAARIMGSKVDEEILQRDARDILELDYLLYNISKEEIGDNDDLEITLGEMNAELNGDTFSYKNLINQHLQHDVSIEDDTMLYVHERVYFQTLPSILAATDKRVLANYIAFNIVQFFAAYSSDNIRNFIYEDELKRIKDEETICMKMSRNFMTLVVGRMYVDRYFPPLTRMHVTKMVEMIRLAYSSTIDQNMWMDENTLLYALVKLQSIQSMVGHEEWIVDDRLLDEYYEKLGEVQEDNYFGAVVILSGIQNDDKYSRWNKTAQRNDSDAYTNNPTVVNAYYIPSSNFIALPAGMFGWPYYKYGRIDSINYGAIGTVIGHEISHAFDTTGRHFDHLGNYREWWTKTTKEKFLNKAHCFVDQYNDYEEELSPVKVDGVLTVGENIADNGGVRNSFKAFRLHLALSGEELNYRKRLPGLSFSPEQLFFLGYASVWCANMSDEYANGFSDNDNHSPNKIRVNVPLANFKEFAKAYQCKPGTPMNPANKCVLW